ncbi:MAG: fatty acid desaturase [Gammaproteobacteria bacterium]|nr:MAG: fatty acid desaturase [Gammaproteobacteria bacterium]
MHSSNDVIPAPKNILLLVAASLINTLLLYWASHSAWWGVIVAAGGFSLSNNTLFSLLHESVHGIFAENRYINRMAGCLAACWFPTGWLIQRAFHLTHHQQNRSEKEQFDILHPKDIRWLKYAQWYSIFTGLYWFITVFGVVVYAITPQIVRHYLIRVFGRQGSEQTSADSYIGILDNLPPVLSRLEIIFSIAWQILLFLLLDLSLIAWLSCYSAFALMWSSLQYTDHAFSPLDNQNGAWNLHVPKWLQSIFLNYHLHLAHHQHPQVPWVYLPRYADKGPRFIAVWLACLRGPRSLSCLPTFEEKPF